MLPLSECRVSLAGEGEYLSNNDTLAHMEHGTL